MYAVYELQTSSHTIYWQRVSLLFPKQIPSLSLSHFSEIESPTFRLAAKKDGENIKTQMKIERDFHELYKQWKRKLKASSILGSDPVK
jgi:hypothetical protein